MTLKEIAAKAAEIKELERMRDELEATISSMTDEIKAEMTEAGTDTLVAGAFKISWKMVTSSRFDTTAFKKAMPDVASRFMKESSCRRFTINC